MGMSPTLMRPRALSCPTLIESRFNVDTDGWTAEPTGTVGITATGNLLVVTDNNADGWQWIAAPATFVSARPAYGSRLSWRLRRLPPTAGQVSEVFPVRCAISGNGTTIVASVGIASLGFETYRIRLSAGPWRVTGLQSPADGVAATETEIRDVLSEITAIYLSADHTSGTTTNDVSEIQFVTLCGVSLPAPPPLEALSLWKVETLEPVYHWSI